MDDRWLGLSKEFAEVGCDYTPEQVSSPEWCARELDRRGFSLALTMVTFQYVRDKLGFENAEPNLFPYWTYQLWSFDHASAIDHTYAMRTIEECASTALFTVCRAEWEQRKKVNDLVTKDGDNHA